VRALDIATKALARRDFSERGLRERLERAGVDPDEAERVLARLRETKGGRLNVSEFGERMRGRGVYWQLVERSFRVHCKRLGFNRDDDSDSERATTFRRPSPQGTLFE
jgi:DNA repair photolyase